MNLPANLSRVSFESVKVNIINKNNTLKDWFDVDNLDLFKTSLPRNAYLHRKYGVIYFVTGEQIRNTRSTAYTVRVLKKSGVFLVSEYQEFKTFEAAEKWLLSYV
jgi:hypothetical protein